MRRHPGRWITAATCLLIFSATSTGRPAASAHDSSTALDRFLSGGEALVSYRATRRLTAENRRFKVAGHLTAATRYDEATGFSYEIVDEGGSGYLRTRVLRKVLERERAARNGDEGSRAALTADNYEFGPATDDESGHIRVTLLPRRREELLLHGTMLLDADGDLIELQGRPARMPSFWTRRVQVVRRYARIEGVRVPVELTSVADVLVAGRSSFRMCYEYAEVNGRTVAPSRSCQ